jgi:hypothetical protein
MSNESRATRRPQGAVTVILAVALLVGVGAMLLVALSMSTSEVHDTASQASGTRALFLAESGVERAGARLAGGTSCTALAATLPEGPFSLAGSSTFTLNSAATTDFQGNPLPTGACRVRTTGTADLGAAVRTVEGILSSSSGIAVLNETFPDASSFTSMWGVTGPNGNPYDRACPAAGDNVTAQARGNGAATGYDPTSSAPGSAGGSLEAQTADGVAGDSPGGRLTQYRQTSLSSSVPGGSTVTLSVWHREWASSPKPERLTITVDLVSTTGMSYRIWCVSNTNPGSTTAWQQVTATLTVPGNGTVQYPYLRVGFDLQNKVGGGQKLANYAWVDDLKLQINGLTVSQWREIVR